MAFSFNNFDTSNSAFGGSSSGGGALSTAVSNAATPAGAPAPSTPSPGLNAFDSYGLGGGAQNKLEKFAGIIQSGGTLTPSQEAKLSNISTKAGLDFASDLGYTPTSGRYTYAPTPDPAGVRAQNYTGNDIRTADSGGSGDVTAVAQYGAQPQGGMVENPWEASAGDLYQNLNPNQEAKFNKFAGMYAAGEDLRPGQLNKLDKFLGMADLGTRESYFARNLHRRNSGRLLSPRQRHDVRGSCQVVYNWRSYSVVRSNSKIRYYARRDTDGSWRV